MIAAGGNPDRLGQRSPFAALCGVSPIPASWAKRTATGSTEAATDKPTAALHTVS